MSILSELLIAFGGNAALLLVLAFLARSLIQTWLAKDVKRFEMDLQSVATSQLEHLKYDLKSQGDASIEELKSQLQQSALEHQVRFLKLHEKRAEVIAEMYGRLVEAEVEGLRFLLVEGHANTGKQQEAWTKNEKTISTVSLFIEKNRIYLPENVCVLLKTFLDKVRQHVTEFGVYGSIVNPTQQTQIQTHEVLMRALKAFQEEIPAAKRALEDEFRGILGVENPRA